MSTKKEFLGLELSASSWVNYGALFGTLTLIISTILSSYFVYLSIAFMALLFGLESKRAPLLRDSLKFRKDRLYKLPKELEIAPDSEGIIWMYPTQEFIENQKFLFKILTVVMAIMVGVIGYLMKAPIFLVLLLMIVTVYAIKQGIEIHDYTLGVDDENFYYKSDTVDKKVKIKDSTYTDYTLDFDDETSLLLDTKERGFDENQLGSYLYPRLKEASYYNNWQRIKRDIKKESKALLFMVGVIVLFLFMSYILGFYFCCQV
ncbi:MAG: hypothetical protein U9N49_07060 [Campylobacterota bacterium]|nr:hypothetical protein [Campylobacterota bacterium]